MIRNMLSAIRFTEAGLRAEHVGGPERQGEAPDSAEAAGGKRCSFCGKREEQVRKVISGPGVQICDACVAVCGEILRDGGLAGRP